MLRVFAIFGFSHSQGQTRSFGHVGRRVGLGASNSDNLPQKLREAEAMPLNQQVITDTICSNANDLLQTLGRLTPGESYGTAVAFVSLVGDYQPYYCYGSADNNGTPVTEATIFSIGSLTKPFTATLLAYATSQKLASYTDPVTQYLTYYGVHGGSLLQQITLRDLAMHTSGLQDATLSPKDGIGLFQDDPSSPPSDLTGFWEGYNTGKGPTPGSCWEYSDLGFVTLGFAVVAANSANYKSYAGLLSDVITGPLQMPSTAPTVSSNAPRVQGHSNGVFVKVTGASDLKSNLADMYQWTLQNLLALTIQNPIGLMQALAATTTVSPLNLPPCTPGSVPANMGLAWQGTSGMDGYPVIVWKDGLTFLGGCSGWIGMIPAQGEPGTITPGTGMGIVILVNGFVVDPQFNINVIADSYGWSILRMLYNAAR
jgi:beta-lactamase class C